MKNRDDMGLAREDASQIREGFLGTDFLLPGEETPIQRLIRERIEEIICEKISLSLEENMKDPKDPIT